MNVKTNWTIVKNRYRLSSKVQMSFELGFPKYLIGKCRCSIKNDDEIRTKKVSFTPKGVVFSDTIPLGWFTSSVFIPWEKVQSIDIPNTPVSSDVKHKTLDIEYRTLGLNDPEGMTIDFPWSNEFTAYVQGKVKPRPG